MEVSAVSVNSGSRKLAEVDETTAAILRFDGERVASFVTSFNAADVGELPHRRHQGSAAASTRAYEYAEGLAYELTVDGKTTRKRIGKRDQFAPELLHFSDCIQRNIEPEPSGEEGLQDVRIVEALYESADTGKVVTLPRHHEAKRPTGRQIRRRPGVKKPRLVRVRSASTCVTWRRTLGVRLTGSKPRPTKRPRGCGRSR